MKFQKGNKLGGRKTIAEEIAHAKERMKELTIEELATDKVYKQITTLKGRDKEDRQGIKDIALPVYLKSKADKIEHSGEVEVKTFNFLKNERDNTDNNSDSKTGGSVGEDMGQDE